MKVSRVSSVRDVDNRWKQIFQIFLAVTTILSLGVLVFAEPPGYNYNAPSGGSDFSAGNVGGGGGGSSGGHAFVIPIPVRKC